MVALTKLKSRTAMALAEVRSRYHNQVETLTTAG